MSFLNEIEAQAKAETERVIKELTQLKFDAQQVIHVLNALKLEVPKELRELSPIERVPIIPGGEIKLPEVEKVDYDTGEITFREECKEPVTSSSGKSVDVQVQQRETRNKGSLAAVKVRQAKAAKREQEIRKAITEQLSKGPVLRAKLVDALPYPDSAINTIGTRMKKEGLLDYRVVGFQGPTEWFLPSRPITLETLRDEVVKTEGEVPLERLRERFGFKSFKDLGSMLRELVAHGTLTFDVLMDRYYYEKPKSTSIKTAAEHQRTKNFGGGVNGVSGDKISSNKEVRAMVAKAKAQGANVKLSGGNHISVSFAGKTTTIGKTPGASGLLQDTQNLKKMGLRV